MFYGTKVESRLLLGTAGYPSPDILAQAIDASETQVITVSLRREGVAGGAQFRQFLQQTQTKILPNTAGCYSVKEAVTTAHMAREVFGTSWVKLEVIGHPDTLQPNPFALVDAARILCEDGFQVFPYTTEDLVVAEKLLNVGCEVLMPWASPIGSGQGIRNIEGLRSMRASFSDVPLIIDAGIGAPSQATQVMEMGFDAVLLNTAVAKSKDPIQMASAFKYAMMAGRTAYEAGLMPKREMAHASTPTYGLADLGQF